MKTHHLFLLNLPSLFHFNMENLFFCYQLNYWCKVSSHLHFISGNNPVKVLIAPPYQMQKNQLAKKRSFHVCDFKLTLFSPDLTQHLADHLETLLYGATLWHLRILLNSTANIVTMDSSTKFVYLERQ